MGRAVQAGPDLRRGYWPRWPPNRPEAQVDARTDGGRRARVWPHRPPGGARFSRRARGRRLRHQRFSSDREPGIRGTGSEARRVRQEQRTWLVRQKRCEPRTPNCTTGREDTMKTTDAQHGRTDEIRTRSAETLSSQSNSEIRLPSAKTTAAPATNWREEVALDEVTRYEEYAQLSRGCSPPRPRRPLGPGVPFTARVT